MGIQILQYEFLGPVPLSEWAPPMGELLYLVLSKDRDLFSILYAGDCEHTDDKGFFVQHKQFGCWVQKTGSEQALHLAVLPLKDYDSARRQSILQRIISHYRPPCNPVEVLEKKPSYNVRRTDPDVPAANANDSDPKTDGEPDSCSSISRDGNAGSDYNTSKKIQCPCCGSAMSREKDVGSNSALYRCSGCGMSDTRLD